MCGLVAGDYRHSDRTFESWLTARSAARGARVTIPFQLDGSVAVLTGAGSGIGRATALSLAARGARIAASDVDASRAEETAALVAAGGGEAIGLRVDVAQQTDLEELRDRTLEQFGRVDV